MSERTCPVDPHERPCSGGKHYCCATPDHPVEDAREARLSEGEVERLREALTGHRQDHNPKTGASHCSCGRWIGPFTLLPADRVDSFQAHLTEALAPVVADMLTQREREVVARVEAVLGTCNPGSARAAWMHEPVRRALGGTADGQQDEGGVT